VSIGPRGQSSLARRRVPAWADRTAYAWVADDRLKEGLEGVRCAVFFSAVDSMGAPSDSSYVMLTKLIRNRGPRYALVRQDTYTHISKVYCPPQIVSLHKVTKYVGEVTALRLRIGPASKSLWRSDGGEAGIECRQIAGKACDQHHPESQPSLEFWVGPFFPVWFDDMPRNSQQGRCRHADENPSGRFDGDRAYFWASWRRKVISIFSVRYDSSWAKVSRDFWTAFHGDFWLTGLRQWVCGSHD